MFVLAARIVFRAVLTLLLLTTVVFFGLQLTGDPAMSRMPGFMSSALRSVRMITITTLA